MRHLGSRFQRVNVRHNANDESLIKMDDKLRATIRIWRSGKSKMLEHSQRGSWELWRKPLVNFHLISTQGEYLSIECKFSDWLTSAGPLSTSASQVKRWLENLMKPVITSKMIHSLLTTFSIFHVNSFQGKSVSKTYRITKEAPLNLCSSSWSADNKNTLRTFFCSLRLSLSSARSFPVFATTVWDKATP